MGLSVALTVRAVRNFLGASARILFKSKSLVLLVGAMAVYLGITIFLLHSAGLWNQSHLKTTVIWVIAFAFVSLFGVVDAKNERKFLGSTFKKAVGVTVLLQFVSEFETFQLPVELAIVPIITLTAIARELSGPGKQRMGPSIALDWILMAFGLIFLLKGCQGIADRPQEFFSAGTFLEFFVPVLLTTLYLPFLFGTFFVVTANRFVAVLKRRLDADLWRYTRNRSFVAFLLQPHGMVHLQRHFLIFSPVSKSEVDSSIREVRQAMLRRRLNNLVSPAIGWRPEDAVRLLENRGFKTGLYSRGYDGWGATSNPVKVPSRGFSLNSIVFVLHGDRFCVRKMWLELSVFDIEDKELAIEMFKECAVELIKKSAYGDVRGQEIQLAAGGGPVRYGDVCYSLEIKDWPAGGFELTLEVLGDPLVERSDLFGRPAE